MVVIKYNWEVTRGDLLQGLQDSTHDNLPYDVCKGKVRGYSGCNQYDVNDSVCGIYIFLGYPPERFFGPSPRTLKYVYERCVYATAYMHESYAENDQICADSGHR